MSNLGVRGLPQAYDVRPAVLGFMDPANQSPNRSFTEPYVSIPPALIIYDSEGAVWTLGFDYSEIEWRAGRYEYDIVRNGRKTGEFGRIIEYRKSQVRIWGAEGWRCWNGRCFI